MDPRIQYLFAVAPTVLLLAVMVIGIILAVHRRRQQPWTARLVIPGLVALAANVIGSIAGVFRWNRHSGMVRIGSRKTKQEQMVVCATQRL
jgi:hypothetical protein